MHLEFRFEFLMGNSGSCEVKRNVMNTIQLIVKRLLLFSLLIVALNLTFVIKFSGSYSSFMDAVVGVSLIFSIMVTIMGLFYTLFDLLEFNEKEFEPLSPWFLFVPLANAIGIMGIIYLISTTAVL